MFPASSWLLKIHFYMFENSIWVNSNLMCRCRTMVFIRSKILEYQGGVAKEVNNKRVPHFTWTFASRLKVIRSFERPFLPMAVYFRLEKLLRFLRRGGGVVTAVLFWSFSSPLTSETHFDEPSCWTHCLNICPAGSTPVPLTNDILLLSKTKSVFGALFTEKRSNQQSPITMKAAQHKVRPIVAFLHLTFNLKFPGQEQGSTVGPQTWRSMNPWSRAYLDS